MGRTGEVGDLGLEGRVTGGDSWNRAEQLGPKPLNVIMSAYYIILIFMRKSVQSQIDQ